MALHPSANAPSIPQKPPASCVGWWDPFIGLAVIFAVFLTLRWLPPERLSHSMLALCMIAALGLVLGAIEIMRAPWRLQAPSSEPFTAILRRAGVKYLGFIAGLAFVGFFYWLFPEYRRPYYGNYFAILQVVGPFIPVFFAGYFVFAEWRFPEPKDGSWQAGMFVLGRWQEIDWFKFQQNILGWVVKGYFLPIMTGDLIADLPSYRYANWALWELNFDQLFSLLFKAIISLELVFVACGYALGCRLFNSQMRGVERTMLGWWSALITYGPFLSLTFVYYFNYRSDKVDWNHWLSNDNWLYYVWGSVIILLMLVHMWCDACFGVRFSNLTHRGIITNGCYRFCKHPAYLIKGIRWFMVSVPFVTVNGFEHALRMTLIICGVYLVYIVRSYTEERNLSRDPVYQHYALWMDQHSWLAWVGRLVPWMRYENRLKKWKQQGVLEPAIKEETL